jgi:hypothetical protein
LSCYFFVEFDPIVALTASMIHAIDLPPRRSWTEDQCPPVEYDGGNHDQAVAVESPCAAAAAAAAVGKVVVVVLLIVVVVVVAVDIVVVDGKIVGPRKLVQVLRCIVVAVPVATAVVGIECFAT